MLSRIGKSRLNLQPCIFTRAMSLHRPRPSPPSLPKDDQREFEELVLKAQTTPGVGITGDNHPDARKPIKVTFEGDLNPETGELGGPKQEPVGKWGDEGDWSYKGRVSDF